MPCFTLKRIFKINAKNMLKLLCINSQPVLHITGISSSGEGLKEGEVYTAEGAIHIHPNNKKPCYFILELLDLKLTTRFIPLSDIDETIPGNRTEEVKVKLEIVNQSHKRLNLLSGFLFT